MWWLFAMWNFYDTLSAIHSRQRPPQRSNKCFLFGGIVRQKIASAQRKRNIHKEYCDFSHCRCSSRGNGKGYVPSSIAQKHPNDPFILKCSVKAVWSVLTSSLCVGAIFFCPVIKFWNYCFVRFFIMLSRSHLENHCALNEGKCHIFSSAFRENWVICDIRLFVGRTKYDHVGYPKQKVS